MMQTDLEYYHSVRIEWYLSAMKILAHKDPTILPTAHQVGLLGQVNISISLFLRGTAICQEFIWQNKNFSNHF